MDYKNLISLTPTIEVKDSTEPGIAGTVAVYFSAFDNIDSDSDVIIKGAFEKTIAERGPKGTNQIFHLMQHDVWRPIGKPKELKEDDIGLLSVTPIVDTPLGVDTVKLYKAGVYNEHSIGYRVMAWDEEERDGRPVRILKELKLWEGSTVTWGANPKTPVVWMKSEDKNKLFAQLAERIEKLQKTLTDHKLTDYSVNLLQIELNQINDFIDSLAKDEEPDKKTTPSEYEPNVNELVERFNKRIKTN